MSIIIVNELLLSNIITLEEKYGIFMAVALEASRIELISWLRLLRLNDFLSIYENKKNPTFENTDFVASILEIFKKRGDITDYILDISSDKYIIRRSGTFS